MSGKVSTRVRCGKFFLGFMVGACATIAVTAKTGDVKLLEIQRHVTCSCGKKSDSTKGSGLKQSNTSSTKVVPFPTKDSICKHNVRLHITRKCSSKLSHEQAKAMAPYLVDNPYIHNGFRESGMHWRDCITSVFEIHNETFNVWSHGIAAVYFMHECLVRHRVPERIFAFNAALTFGTSAIAHTFHSHSAQVSHHLFVCDRASISNLFFAAAVACNMIHFRRPDQARKRAIGIVASAMFYLGTAYSVIRGGRHLKLVLMLVAQASSVVIPVLKELARASPSLRKIIIRYLVSTISWSATGASLFVAYLPERLLPGWFCYLLHSHNLMHVMVAIGTHQLLEGLRQWGKAVGYGTNVLFNQTQRKV